MGMFGNIKDLQTDEQLENEGVDLDIGKGRFIRVARSGGGNRKYRAFLTEEYRKNKSVMERGALDEEQSAKMMRKLFAMTVVLGWKGFTDENGDEIPYSVDNCMKLFEEAPEIFRIVQEEADKFQHFALEETEQAGNSLPSTSSGTGSGESMLGN